MEARRRELERMVASPTVVKRSTNTPLRELVDTIKAQNEILLKQVDLLKAENDHQKEQVDIAKKSEEQARKEALHAKWFNWITFCITTTCSIAAIIISIFVK